MYIKSLRKCERASFFGKLAIFSLVSLNLLCPIASANVKNVSFKTFEGIENVRPEETLLNVFARSFNPQNGTVSADCQRDSDLYRAALRDYKPWALQMYDSSTKIPFGVIMGNYKQVGNYDECLKVRSDYGFVGKACSTSVQFLLTSGDGNETKSDVPDMHDLLLKVGLASGLRNWTSDELTPYEWLWCVPSSCSARDVAKSIEVDLNPLKRSPKVDFIVTVRNDSCHTEISDRAVFVEADWVYISLLLFFGITIVASTIYDLVQQRNPANPDLKDTTHKILTCFSVYTNGKNLLNVQRSADTVLCLDGIRFLTICWIIYGHTVTFQFDGITLNLDAVSMMYKRWDTLLVTNMNVATDIFLLLSGTLLAYSEMTRKEKNPKGYKFNIWNMYLHRYLRLTPAYAMVIGFYATLLYKTGSGPRWNHYAGANSHYCMNSWWMNLLYINNYADLPTLCMSQSWYVAVDMQMFWLSPIFLYPMLGKSKRKQKIFLILLTTTFVASILTPFLITYCDRLTGTVLFYQDLTDASKVYLEIYTRVYTRGGPYLLGLGFGYFLNRIKHRKKTMPTGLVIAGWTISIVAALAVLFGPREFYSRHHQYNVIGAAFYAGFHRSVFALAVGWIIVASVFGCAGPVGALLSSNVWTPLSKLTYTAYLSHYMILLYYAGNSRTPEHYTIYNSIHTFCATLVVSLFVSVILYLCVEVPFCRLDQLLISYNRYNVTRRRLNEEKSTPEIHLPTSSIISTSYNGSIDNGDQQEIDSSVPSSDINNSTCNDIHNENPCCVFGIPKG